jgi:hypothetical protein
MAAHVHNVILSMKVSIVCSIAMVAFFMHAVPLATDAMFGMEQMFAHQMQVSIDNKYRCILHCCVSVPLPTLQVMLDP